MNQWYKILIASSILMGLLNAEVLIVNDTSDLPAVDPTVSALTSSGTITIRSAIQRSNFNGGSNTINFSIPGTGPFIITPASQYDVITNSLTIDGYSQPGALPNTNTPQDGGLNAIIMIEIQGQNILNQYNQPAFATVCFNCFADSCVFKGLAINQFFGNGIQIRGNDWHIGGCFIGTDASGTIAPGGAFQIVTGAFLQGAGSVGGVDPAERNLILGSFSCITTESTGGTITIMGNLFNTDKTGTLLLSASETALNLQATTLLFGGTVIVGGSDPRARNLISGAGLVGVYARFSSLILFAENNYIGTDITGTQSLANTNGIVIDALGNYTKAYIAGNIIAGNRADGIVIKESFASSTILGNSIGLNALGDPLGNGKDGIFLFNTRAITIGDGTPAGANSISANGRNGIWVGANAFYTHIIGNYIGTNSAMTPLGNMRNGIRIGGDMQPAHTTYIGGFNSGEQNVIAYNGNHGIHIRQQSDGTQILNNQLLENQGNGIRDTNTARQTLIQGNRIQASQKGIVIGQDASDLSQGAIISNSIS